MAGCPQPVETCPLVASAKMPDALAPLPGAAFTIDTYRLEELILHLGLAQVGDDVPIDIGRGQTGLAQSRLVNLRLPLLQRGQQLLQAMPVDQSFPTRTDVTWHSVRQSCQACQLRVK
ncbi:hypothetical protein [Stomatohabitans albus]|uniref:hypothetical protein n=1 Tax=Stomatohabitans albus TaxID=3110766 RepID=UPI00300D1BC6